MLLENAELHKPWAEYRSITYTAQHLLGIRALSEKKEHLFQPLSKYLHPSIRVALHSPQRSFLLPWEVVNAETHNWSACQEEGKV